ncbi:guanine deaminase [Methylovirgula sp. 4M-Z18]|uniref:guanine deaminase n=1 Tax=Methylovirgula sp. 4M-Z18 TaxID=2293567 RepID=UPI000E2FE1EF|nr:guanine deaminase [Methylovirgula sp. 4M-Z18]RFB80907.1 guanine deaminase [Methylovirgula sp. 4M-Z18]
MAVGRVKALRGRVLTFTADPDDVGLAACYRYLEDGLVVVNDGRISDVGDAATLLPSLPAGAPVDHYPHELILPGFIDTHIHFPQTRVIGSYGTQLLEWLQKYTFIEEQKYRDPVHAAAGAKFFLDELLRNGTTTAVVYCSAHPESVEAFFAESERRGTRMVAGKVMMDRNAPEALRDTPQSGYDQSKALLQKWDKRGRQHYVISPRFAITSTEAQMEMAQALVREHPDVYVQTHLCENVNEIAYVKTLFPKLTSYTGIYEHYGLLGPKSIFGHCVHLEDEEVAALSGSNSIAAFCPTSNLFLGSGLFNMARLKNGPRPVKVSIATDVGGGTSYSMLRTAAEAYKILQLQQQSWPALAAFHMMTRGNALTLGLGDKIGTLEPGREADIVVLDARATPAMQHRMESVHGDIAEELFILMMMGDDRNVKATYVAGNKV